MKHTVSHCRDEGRWEDLFLLTTSLFSRFLEYFQWSASSFFFSSWSAKNKRTKKKNDFERVSIFWGLFRRPEKVLNKVKWYPFPQAAPCFIRSFSINYYSYAISHHWLKWTKRVTISLTNIHFCLWICYIKGILCNNVNEYSFSVLFWSTSLSSRLSEYFQ